MVWWGNHWIYFSVLFFFQKKKREWTSTQCSVSCIKNGFKTLKAMPQWQNINVGSSTRIQETWQDTEKNAMLFEIIKLTKEEGNINQKQKWINLKSFNVCKIACGYIFVRLKFKSNIVATRKSIPAQKKINHHWPNVVVILALSS